MARRERLMSETGRMVLGSYTDYQEAQRELDTLADRGFPVRDMAIVGSDLRLVEHVTGRETWASVAASGVLHGGLTGAFLGFLFGLLSIVDPLVSGLALAFYGLLLGAGAGLIIGLVGHAATSGRPDFRSFRALDAARYDVVCEDDVAADAERILDHQDVRAGR
jgi:hypothetical protein